MGINIRTFLSSSIRRKQAQTVSRLPHPLPLIMPRTLLDSISFRFWSPTRRGLTH